MGAVLGIVQRPGGVGNAAARWCHSLRRSDAGCMVRVAILRWLSHKERNSQLPKSHRYSLASNRLQTARLVTIIPALKLPTNLPIVVVNRKGASRLLAGHSWVYKSDVT